MKKNLVMTKKDGDVADIPMEFEILPLEKEVPTKIDLSQELIDQSEEKFGKGPLTTQVKLQIKRCIRANLKTAPTKRLSMAQTKKLYAQMRELAQRNKDLPEGSDKYRRMLKDYLSALGTLIAEIEKEMGRENEKYVYSR